MNVGAKCIAHAMNLGGTTGTALVPLFVDGRFLFVGIRESIFESRIDGYRPFPTPDSRLTETEFWRHVCWIN